MRRLVLRIGLAPVLLVSTALAAAEDSRYAVRGEVQAIGRSEDGRYALQAELRRTASTASPDGRFELKAVNVPEASCNPAVELFADGFEGG